jgi:putative ABC transport system permease protein
VPFGNDDYEPLEVDAVDPANATAARGLHATQGNLDDLHGPTAAVSETWVVSDSGTGLGGHLRARIAGERVDLRIVAIVPDAPDLYGEILLPADLVADELDNTPPSEIFVVLEPGTDTDSARASLEDTLSGTDSRVLAANEWIDAVTANIRRANNFGLTILLGPAGFYAAIAVVNATLIGATQRRRQHEALTLLGATRDQLRRTALWQAALVSGAGLALGALTIGFLGWLVRRAVTTDLAGTGVDVPMTIPWLPMLGIVLACIGLTLAAATAGVRGLKSRAASS